MKGKIQYQGNVNGGEYWDRGADARSCPPVCQAAEQVLQKESTLVKHS